MQLKPLFLLWILVIGTISLSAAQQNVSSPNAQKIVVSGTFKNEKNLPAEFVSVVFFNASDSSHADAAIADTTGTFRVSVAPGNYRLIASVVGYQKFEQIVSVATEQPHLGDFVLVPATNQLSEVEVKAAKPLVEKKVDRLIFNVENSIVVIGNTAWDVLGRTPMVQTTQDARLIVRGRPGATVYINDKRIYLTGEQLMAMLSAMPADNISKIEVITSPGAKYDAAGRGTIINIVLKKKPELGFQGSVQSTYTQTTYAKYAFSPNFNYRSEKWNIYGNARFGKGRYYNTSTTDQQYINTSSVEQEKGETDSESNSVKIGMEFTPDKKQTISLVLDGGQGASFSTDNNQIRYFREKTTTDSSFNGRHTGRGERYNINANLSYKAELDTAGRSLSADFDYASFLVPWSQSNNMTLITNQNQEVIPSGFRTSSEAGNTVYAVKTDYSHPINKSHTLNFGAKLTRMGIKTDRTFDVFQDGGFVADAERSNDFTYREAVQAVYGEYSGTIGKFETKIGLRGERTQLTGETEGLRVVERSYANLFPSLSVQYTHNDNWSYGLSYERSIFRPGYNDLNPVKYYMNLRSYRVGNPSMPPSIDQGLDFSVTLKNSYFFSVGYYTMQNFATSFPEQDPVTNLYRYRAITLDNWHQWSFSFNTSQQLTSWWQSSINAYLVLSDARWHLNGQKFSNQGSIVNLSSNNYFTVSKPKKLTGELSITYRPSAPEGFYRIGAYCIMNIGIKKSFAKDKATFSLMVNDIFNAYGVPMKVNYGGQSLSRDMFPDQRGVRCTLSYKFGKQTVKRVNEKYEYDRNKGRING